MKSSIVTTSCHAFNFFKKLRIKLASNADHAASTFSSSPIFWGYLKAQTPNSLTTQWSAQNEISSSAKHQGQWRSGCHGNIYNYSTLGPHNGSEAASDVKTRCSSGNWRGGGSWETENQGASSAFPKNSYLDFNCFCREENKANVRLKSDSPHRSCSSIGYVCDISNCHDSLLNVSMTSMTLLTLAPYWFLF